VGHVRVGVLGQTTVSLDGDAVRLTPRTVRLLLRLVAAEGDAVTASDIYMDVWGRPPRGLIERGHRIQVQQRVLELRQKLEPGQPPELARFPRTESVLAGQYAQSAYRLVLDREQLDWLEFAHLINRAGTAPPATAVALLTRALGLWRGQPLADAVGQEFATPLARRLRSLHKTAREALVRHQVELGDLDATLPVAERLAAEFPEDTEVAGTLRSIRERIRARNPSDVLRREFPRIGVRLVVRRGDLFEQDDANLVVGFGDTFDTATENDAVVSRASVQGQLLERVYGGKRARLDGELTRALVGVRPLVVESARAKPRGKRRRYPVGTVAPLPLDGRRVFAFVHCRQDLHLVTHSSAAELRHALEQLWESVRKQGLLVPVAVPLVGAGLARVDLSREQLMIMIIDTFLKSCAGERCTPELRIVLRPADLKQIRISDVARFVEALDQSGNPSD
jgi:DNA-binding SARP family transcriptional activator